MEQDHLSPGPAGPDCDRETFERVWRRVMPTDRPDCPFTLYCDEDPPLPTPDPAPAPDPCPAVVPEERLPCLGEGSAVYGAFLQERITQALGDVQTYRLAARLAPAAAARTLTTLSRDRQRSARRLSAAYFLISGVEFTPAPRRSLPPSATYRSVLRQCFMEAQRSAGAYRSTAAGMTDPCLQSLCLELAEEELAHARLLRALLEQG